MKSDKRKEVNDVHKICSGKFEGKKTAHLCVKPNSHKGDHVCTCGFGWLNIE